MRKIRKGIGWILAAAVLLEVSAMSAPTSTDPLNTLRWKEGDRGDWFEWWYYKLVLPESAQSFYFIYGVVDPWDSSGQAPVSQSYTGFGSFSDRLLLQSVLPATSFAARRDETRVEIGDNLASDHRLQGSIAQGGRHASWDIDVERDWSFNAMGWASTTQDLVGIYWYPAQASARMSGWIELDGKTTRFENAPAYQDRNWGRSFPKWWTWLVSNHFQDSPGTVLVAGGGRPQYLTGGSGRGPLDGICIGLRYQGEDYAWRTPDADSIQMKINYGTWEVSAENRRGEKIEISARAPKEKFLVLPFQTPQGPQFYDYEALQGQMVVRLYRRKLLGWKKVVELNTDQAGIEYGSFDPHPAENVFNRVSEIQE